MYFWYPDNALSVWILARGDNVEKTFAVLSGSFEVHAEQNGCLTIVEASILLVCAILNIPLTLVLMIWIMDIFDTLNLDIMVLQWQGLGFEIQWESGQTCILLSRIHYFAFHLFKQIRMKSSTFDKVSIIPQSQANRSAKIMLSKFENPLSWEHVM